MLCSPPKLHTPISRALPPGLQVYLQVSPSPGSSNLFLSGSFVPRISLCAASGCTAFHRCAFAGSPAKATARSIPRPPAAYRRLPIAAPQPPLRASGPNLLTGISCCFQKEAHRSPVRSSREEKPSIKTLLEEGEGLLDEAQAC